MSVKLLTEYHLEFPGLKGGCTGSAESTLFKMPHCWKSHITAHDKISKPIGQKLAGHFSEKTNSTTERIGRCHPCRRNLWQFMRNMYMHYAFTQIRNEKCIHEMENT